MAVMGVELGGGFEMMMGLGGLCILVDTLEIS